MQSTNLIGHDPQSVMFRPASLIKKFFMLFIREERDIDLFSCIIKLGILLPGSAATMYFVPAEYRLYLGLFHVVLYLFYLGPYTLMLHNTSHRQIFHFKLQWLNFFPQAVLSFFFGMSPYTYFSHHLGMHHPENNLPSDLSSTMKYKRDSFLHFLHYYFMFAVFGFFTLLAYFFKKRRWQFIRKIMLGEASFYLIVVFLAMVNFQATLFAFIIPFLATRFLLMAGNWTQHAFVDGSDPANPYLNSITFIDSIYNRRCFNDGYHIGHHVNMNRHFLDMPADFLENLELYKKHQAIVFRKHDYFILWIFLMTHSYGVLANNFVDLAEKKRSKEEIIALLKSRVQPIKAA